MSRSAFLQSCRLGLALSARRTLHQRINHQECHYILSVSSGRCWMALVALWLSRVRVVLVALLVVWWPVCGVGLCAPPAAWLAAWPLRVRVCLCALLCCAGCLAGCLGRRTSSLLSCNFAAVV